MALFALEPFVGKVLLPRMGGTPMVWNTCVLVFQLLLLAGYWYSVQLGRMHDAARAARVHRALVVAAAVSWPLTVRALWIAPWPGVPPALWIIAVCVAGIGLPFVVLSATSPLVQLWRARDAAAASTVHRLYAVGNIASVVGLLLYVGVIEPLLGVRMQSWLIWAIALAGTVSALRFAPSASEPEHPSTGAPASAEASAGKAEHPRTRLQCGQQVARNRAASACMDISDGLADAVAQIAEASGTGARLDSSKIPVDPTATLEQALTGGEDYELLFAVPARRRRAFEKTAGRQVIVTCIGELTSTSGVVLVRDGVSEPLGGGFSHF